MMSPENQHQVSSLSTRGRLAINIWAALLTFATEVDVEGSDVEGLEEMQLKQFQSNI